MDSIYKSRRSFLKQVGLVSTLAILHPHWSIAKTTLTPSGNRLFAPNERINLACIGIGNRGGEITQALYNTGQCNIVAICDTDMGAPHTQKVMGLFPKAKQFQDFRKMFDSMSNEIDAVCVGLPDHSHFPACMHAMALGKHVYVEKPMARTFLENELMMKAAAKNNVVTQMGNQGHSEANYFQFKAWKDAGIIKDVTAITAHMNNPRRWHGWDTGISSFPVGEKVPETLDWDLWIAASTYHDYHKDFINGQWRCWYDYGMGALGDWGAHIIDTAHEFLDLGLPYEINPVKLSGHNAFFFPMSSTIMFRFPERQGMPPVDISWYDGVDNIPSVPEGYGQMELDPNIPPTSVGKIQPTKLNPGKEIYSKDLTFKGGSHGSTLSIIGEEKAKAMANQLPDVPKSTSNHFENFLLSCKGQEITRSPFALAGPLSQVFCLGVIAQQLNTPIKFDRDKKIITNSKLGNELLKGNPPRKGWEDYYKV